MCICFQNLKQEVINNFYGDTPEARFNIEPDLPHFSKPAAGKRPCSTYLYPAPSPKKHKLPGPVLKGEVERPSNLPWTIRASFKCQICSDVIWGKDRMKKHYEVNHRETAPKEPGDVVNAELHNCFVCGQKVFHDSFELTAHLAMKHEMTVDEYAQKHLEKKSPSVSPSISKEEFSCSSIETEPDTILPDNPLDLEISTGNKEMSIVSLETTTDDNRAKARKGTANRTNSGNSVNNLDDRCLFSCSDCDETFANKQDACDHLDSLEHRAFTPSYASQTKSTLVDVPLKSFIDGQIEKQVCGEHIDMPVEQAKKGNANFNKKDKPSVKFADDAANLWYDQCLVKCKRCRKTFDTSDTALAHEMKQKHGKCRFVRKVHYQCRICQSSILCNKFTIFWHLNVNHGLTIKEYGNIYENKMTTTTCTIAAKLNRKDKKNPSSLNKQQKPAATPKKIPTMTPESTNEGEKIWSDRCLYSCGTCSKSYTNLSSAGKHTRMYKHKKCIVISEPSYDCKICKVSIRWNGPDISRHVRKYHDLSVIEYGKIHKEHEKSDISQLNEVDLLNEVSKVNENQLFHEESQAKNTSEGEKMIAAVSRIGNDWFDKCVFQCKTCLTTFTSYNSFYNHKRSLKHKGHTYISTARYSCQICNASVMWQKETIKAHLHRAHKKLSVDDYARDYERRSSSSHLALSPEVDGNLDVIAKNKSESQIGDETETKRIYNESPLCRSESKVAHEDIKSVKCPLSDSCKSISDLSEYSTHLTMVHSMVQSELMTYFMDEMRGWLGM
jgi:hypothetical protein